ncbi:putative bifunctional diguanylate cyclase/phosphodiesterase [Roseibium aestuarii]|uniref:Bifunctional diguanylate cyclase/phosphodiesterase n=1 Tax=Roseibium aestuarii TaxID=2600299 RepID=A0ABW4JVF4_9HYPH|nr:bifunctional diguanylate cyclase/phosphodiesterase [Roseibium aestuarii]
MTRKTPGSGLNRRLSATVAIAVALAMAAVAFLALPGVTYLNQPRTDYGQHLIRHMRFTYSELTGLDVLLRSLDNRKSDAAAMEQVAQMADHLYIRMQVLSGLKTGPISQPDSTLSQHARELMEQLDDLVADGAPINGQALSRLQILSSTLLRQTGDYTRKIEEQIDALVTQQKRQAGNALKQVVISIIVLVFCVSITSALLVYNRSIVRQLKASNGRDNLTGLLNRRGLDERLRRNMVPASVAPQAVLVFDLDRFKVINDQFGHDAGDAMLRAAGQSLSRMFGRNGYVARWGGDEFVCVVEAADADDLQHQLEELISEPPSVRVKGQDMPVRFSCGICMMPTDARTLEEAMSRADAALLEVKRTGRGRHAFYSEAMTERHKVQDRIRSHLGAAIRDGELFLEFQPQFDIARRKMVSAEALLRWQCSRTGRLVPPSEFIPIAEESDLIWAIDTLVLDQACQTASHWLRGPNRLERIAVNLSPHSFQRLDLIHRVASALKVWSIPADCLEVEITEGVLLSDSPQVLANLDALADLGVRIALDDFGTGYSNIAYLARLKPDLLKIDRSFLREADDLRKTRIVEGISQLADTLGAETLIEGVETEADLLFSRNAGCQYAQGFHLARPMSADALTAFLQGTPAEGRPMPAAVR